MTHSFSTILIERRTEKFIMQIENFVKSANFCYEATMVINGHSEHNPSPNKFLYGFYIFSMMVLEMFGGNRPLLPPWLRHWLNFQR